LPTGIGGQSKIHHNNDKTSKGIVNGDKIDCTIADNISTIK
jgi:hypothetical protein